MNEAVFMFQQQKEDQPQRQVWTINWLELIMEPEVE